MSSNLKIILKLFAAGILLYLIIEGFITYNNYYNNYKRFPEVNKIYTLDYYFYYGKYKYKDLSKVFPDSTDKNEVMLSEYNNLENTQRYYILYNQYYENINPYSEAYTNKIYIVDSKENLGDKWVKFQLIKDGKKDNKYYYLKKYKLHNLLK